MGFKQFLYESMLGTFQKKLQVSPSDFLRQFIVINPPMKLKSANGEIDEIKSPTRFKIIGYGKNFLRIKDLGFGHFPYEEKSSNAGKIYTITGSNMDLFLKPPPGMSDSGGGMGGMGGMSSGGLGGLGGNSPPLR
jgi:hypothetical protein